MIILRNSNSTFQILPHRPSESHHGNWALGKAEKREVTKLNIKRKAKPCSKVQQLPQSFNQQRPIIPLQTAKMLFISLNSFGFSLKPKHIADTSSCPFFLEIILPNYMAESQTLDLHHILRSPFKCIFVFESQVPCVMRSGHTELKDPSN